MPCALSGGIECKNKDNGGDPCFDYKVAFFCPSPHVRATGAPIKPFDSCTGVTCSGHGECRRAPASVPAEGYLCSCERGYFQRDCDDSPIRISKPNNVSECGGPALEHKTPGTQYVWCADAVVDSMGYSDVELTILTSPSADVTCRIQSSSIADVQAVQTARFPAGSAL